MDTNADLSVQIITQLPVERWPEYRDLRLRALETAPQAFGQSWVEAASRPEEHWRQRLIDAAEGKDWLVFAEKSGSLIGMSGAHQWPEDVEANRAMIIAVFVDEEARGNGLGERMVTAVLEQMKLAGLTSAILTVNPVQVAAVRLYERMGFNPVGSEINLMGDGSRCEEIVMERTV